MNYYLAVLKKYATFSWRAQRAEYWFFVLFNLIVSIILMIAWWAIGLNYEIAPWAEINLLLIIYSLGVFIPTLAVLIRRLHDTGRSGWWLLISIIPLIGTIWLIILLCLDSQVGENEHWPNPKWITAVQ